MICREKLYKFERTAFEVMLHFISLDVLYKEICIPLSDTEKSLHAENRKSRR